MRWRTLLISVVVLAAAGYLAWRLVTDKPAPSRTPPSIQPAPDTRSTDTRAETLPVDARPVAGAPEVVPSADDRIEGTVYDDQRRPVADAEVQIVKRDYLSASTRPVDRRWEEKVMASTTSDQAGRYAFAQLVQGELSTVRASKPGFVPVFTDNLRVPKTHDITLARGAPVGGRAVNAATQQPIEGVGVKGWHDSAGGSTASKWMEEVFTNRAGEYSFEGVPAGTVTFMLAQPEYVDLLVNHTVWSGRKNEFRFEMQRGLTIEGIVLSSKDGSPVADVAVAAKDANPVVPRWTGRTDQAGVFRMVGVKPGKVPFELSGRRMTALRELRELTEAEDFSDSKKGRRLEFRALPAARASGRVVTRTGDPIAGARIFVAPIEGGFSIVRDPGQYAGSVGDGEMRTDATGVFLVDGLAAPRHRIVAEAVGFAVTVSDPIATGPGELAADVVLTLNPAPAIQGMVVDESGVPVANTIVTADIPPCPLVVFSPGFDLGQPAQRKLVTDESGRFRFEIPYGTEVTVRADHQDYVLEEALATVKELEPDVIRDFVLRRALEISGTVIDERGQGDPNAVVRSWPERSTKAIETRCEPSGAYRLTRLEAGLFRVNASNAGSGLMSAFRNDVPAGTSGVDFSLLKLGEITGTVTGVGGAPLTKFRVVSRPFQGRDEDGRKPSIAGLTSREQDVDDPSGVFRIVNVEPAKWWVQILSADYSPSVPVEILVPGGGPTSAGTFAMREGGGVRGRIVGVSGAPIGGVMVQVIRMGSLPDQDPATVPPIAKFPVTRSGPNGDYEFRGLVPGQYQFKLEADGFVDPTPGLIPIPEGAPIERSFTMKLAASVELRLTDDVGEPVGGAAVQVMDDQKRKLQVLDRATQTYSDASGRVVVRKLPAGENLTIKAVRVGFVVLETPSTKLRVGENGTLELRLERIR